MQDATSNTLNTLWMNSHAHAHTLQAKMFHSRCEHLFHNSRMIIMIRKCETQKRRDKNLNKINKNLNKYDIPSHILNWWFETDKSVGI